MIDILFEDNQLTIDFIIYSFTIEWVEEDNVLLNLIGKVNHTLFRINANDVTINGVLQTSGQMIFDTLNGQS